MPPLIKFCQGYPYHLLINSILINSLQIMQIIIPKVPYYHHTMRIDDSFNIFLKFIQLSAPIYSKLPSYDGVNDLEYNVLISCHSDMKP